jgi:hypothetical protein
MSKKGYVEPTRTFPIAKYGSSAVIVLDKGLRKALGIKWDEINDKSIGIRADNIKKVYLNPADDPNQLELDDFITKEENK